MVHERLVLINLPTAFQQELLAEIVSLLKAGGAIALQEFDSASYVCYPEHPSWNILLSFWNDSFYANGGNEFIGRSLGHLLQSAGVESIQMKVHVDVTQIGSYRRTQLLSLFESVQDLVIACGRITVADSKANFQHTRLIVRFNPEQTFSLFFWHIAGYSPRGSCFGGASWHCSKPTMFLDTRAWSNNG